MMTSALPSSFVKYMEVLTPRFLVGLFLFFSGVLFLGLRAGHRLLAEPFFYFVALV